MRGIYKVTRKFYNTECKVMVENVHYAPTLECAMDLITKATYPVINATIHENEKLVYEI